MEDFHPNISIKMEMDPLGDRPVRACRTQQGNKDSVLWTDSPTDLSMPLTVFLIFNISENECTPRQQLLEHFQRQLQRLGTLYSHINSITVILVLVLCCAQNYRGLHRDLVMVLFHRKDQHGFFAFPVTDAIAPGYSTIIKHPMDFSTMKDKIFANEYTTMTEFKVRQLFSLLCYYLGFGRW